MRGESLFIKEGEKRKAKRGLSKSTINTRLAAVSSFYQFAMEQNATGNFNLVSTIERPTVPAYAEARYLTLEQAQALLRAVPTDTVNGPRNYALFLMYMATGGRNAEVRTMRWGDFRRGGDSSPTHSGWQYR